MYAVFERILLIILIMISLPLMLFCGLVRIIVGLGCQFNRECCFNPLKTGLRRYASMLLHGVQGLRETWGGFFIFEHLSVQMRYIVLFELFDIINVLTVYKQEERPPENISGRVICLKLAHFGDALHVVPMLREMRRQRPNGTIDLVVGPWCEELGTRIPYIDRFDIYTPAARVFTRGKQQSGVLSEVVSLMKLRRRHYDILISSSTTSYIERLLIHALRPVYWVGARCSTRFYYEFSGSGTVEYRQDTLESERIMSLMSLLKLEEGEADLEFWPTSEERLWAKEVEGEVRSCNGGYLVALSPGAGWPDKAWPIEYYAELVRRLTMNLPVKVIILGAPEERCLGQAIIDKCGGAGVRNLVGETTWGQVAALLELCDLWVGNDSALMHLASAMQARVVALFGPTSQSQWAPRGALHRIIKSVNVCPNCKPWHPDSVCSKNRECMRSIQVEQVLEQVELLLGRSV